MSLFHTSLIALPNNIPVFSTIVHLTGKQLYYFTLALHPQRQQKDNARTTDLLSTSSLNYLPSGRTSNTKHPLRVRRQLSPRCARSEGVFLFIRRTPGTTPVRTQEPPQDSHLYLTNLTHLHPFLPVYTLLPFRWAYLL